MTHRCQHIVWLGRQKRSVENLKNNLQWCSLQTCSFFHATITYISSMKNRNISKHNCILLFSPCRFWKQIFFSISTIVILLNTLTIAINYSRQWNYKTATQSLLYNYPVWRMLNFTHIRPCMWLKLSCDLWSMHIYVN